MADELMTLDDMADGKLDLTTLKVYINGDENTVNKPRLLPSVDVGSLAKLNKSVNDKVDLQIATLPSGRKGYPTLAAAQAAQTSLPANTVIEVNNDSDSTKNGVYTWDGVTLVKSNNDVLGQSKSYTNTVASTKVDKDLVQANTSQTVLAAIATSDDKTLAYFDSNGDMFLANDTASVQAQLGYVPQADNYEVIAYALTDSNRQLLLSVLQNGGILLAGDDNTLQQQLAYAKSSGKLANIVATLDTANKTAINQLLVNNGDNSEIVRRFKIDGLYAETVSRRTRIPAIIKTSYGLLSVYSEQMPPKDGDTEGATLVAKQVYLTSDFKVKSVSAKQVIEAPVANTGVVKHPMLGRTANNRIVMIYDARDSTTSNYRNFVRFSDDDGLTWTTATEIAKSTELSSQNIVNGSSGTIVTLSTGRLVCPMYYTNTILCLYSDDNGTTWQWGQTLNGGSYNINESAITVDENDVIYLSVRTVTAYKKLIVTSSDGGQTLVIQSLHDDLPSAICNSTLYYDKDNKVMLHGTPTTGVGSRARYRLSISTDKAVTFPIKSKLFDDAWMVGYSDLIGLGAGVYALAYEGDSYVTSSNNQESIGLLIFNLSGVLSNVSYS